MSFEEVINTVTALCLLVTTINVLSISIIAVSRMKKKPNNAEGIKQIEVPKEVVSKTSTNYNKMKFVEVRDIAKQKGVKKYYKLNKAELIRELKKIEGI